MTPERLRGVGTLIAIGLTLNLLGKVKVPKRHHALPLVNRPENIRCCYCLYPAFRIFSVHELISTRIQTVPLPFIR
jgi:hypothetical protein